MKDTAIEVKVGALVLFSLALLVGFVFVLGDFSFSEGFEFKVEFENAGGLKPGADVAVAGYNIGNVKNLEFVENTSNDAMNAVVVQATLRVEPQYADAVRTSSEFFITTRGVLGEPYIEIVTESYDDPQVEQGAVMRGVDPPRMDLVVSRALKLLRVLTDLLEDPEVATKDLLSNAAVLARTINDIIASNREHIDGAFAGVHTTVDETSTLMKSLNVAVDDGDDLRQMVGDLKVASSDLRRTARHTADLSERVDGRVDPILTDVETITANTRELTESGKRLVADNEAKINDSIDNVHKATEDAAATAADTRALTRQVRDGEGTVGQLLNDREIYDDLKEVMRQIKQKPWKIIWKE